MMRLFFLKRNLSMRFFAYADRRPIAVAIVYTRACRTVSFKLLRKVYAQIAFNNLAKNWEKLFYIIIIIQFGYYLFYVLNHFVELDSLATSSIYSIKYIYMRESLPGDSSHT